MASCSLSAAYSFFHLISSNQKRERESNGFRKAAAYGTIQQRAWRGRAAAVGASAAASDAGIRLIRPAVDLHERVAWSAGPWPARDLKRPRCSSPTRTRLPASYHSMFMCTHSKETLSS
jgi:hypothetical protein